MTAPVLLADAKEYLNFKTTINDTELQKFIDRGIAEAERRLGAIVPVDVTEKHDGGRSTIVLRQPRAVALVSVTYADGTTGDVTTFDIDTDTAVLYRSSGQPACFSGGSRYVTVIYTAGFSSYPPDLVEGLLELIKYNWETQHGSNRGGAAPGYAEEPETQGPTPGDWPPRVQQLLGPYIVPRVG